MKRSSSFIKRKIALFLVLLLSIESFAAVVGDNDGAAFITKAEFDSMKNDFQSQLDRYNSSLDNKIDGAITSYLNGIKVAKTTLVAAPLANWGKVYSFNKPATPSYVNPAFNLFGMIAFHNNNGTLPFLGQILDYVKRDEFIISSGLWRAWWYGGNVYVTVAFPGAGICKKPKITGVQESSGLGTPVWAGLATDWTTKISLAGFGGQRGNLYAFESTGGSLRPPGYLFSNIATFKNKRNARSASEIYDGSFVYFHNNTTGYVTQYSRHTIFDKYDNYSLEITNDTDNDLFEHIVAWSGQDAWHCYDKSWSHTLQTDDLSNQKSKVLACNFNGYVTGWFDYLKTYMQNNDRSWPVEMSAPSRIADMPVEWNNLTVTQATQSNTVPEVGYVGSFSTDTIKQSTNKITQIVDGREEVLDSPSLDSGFLLGYAHSGDQIVWSPIFSDLHYGDHFTSTTASLEVDVWLALSAFGDGYTTKDGSSLLSVSDASGNTATIHTTLNKTTTLKWTMPEDGWIYVKWAPHLADSSDDVTNHVWNIALDLQQSGSYQRTVAG